jgi:hypothetical protein
MQCGNCDLSVKKLYLLPSKARVHSDRVAELCYFCFLHLARRTPRRADVVPESTSPIVGLIAVDQDTATSA